MNSSTDLPLQLEIRGINHVPSFKNSKMISRGNLITAPRKKKWMEQAIRSIASQLESIARTRLGETWTEERARSWIASVMPLDDSRQWVPEILITTRQVEKGQEGAEIIIERLK